MSATLNSSSKVLIVGLNPSGKPVRKNSTFDKLYKWSDALSIEYFSFINAFDYEKKDPNASDIDYNSLSEACNGYEKIIALGNLASGALNKLGVHHFKMPHPSPRNRLLNDKTFETNILDECKHYLKGTNESNNYFR